MTKPLTRIERIVFGIQFEQHNVEEGDLLVHVTQSPATPGTTPRSRSCSSASAS
jgi:hypothetical protein